jgi:hypothetical protein
MNMTPNPFIAPTPATSAGRSTSRCALRRRLMHNVRVAMAATLKQLESFLKELAGHSQLPGRNFDALRLVEVNGKPKFRLEK